MTSQDPLRIKHLEEPEIEFRGGSATTPRKGLLDHGPRLKNNQQQTINAGVVGDRETIQRFTTFVRTMQLAIHPNPTSENISPWKVPFPGTENSNLNISIPPTKEIWQRPIRPATLRGLRSRSSQRQKFYDFLDELDDALESLDMDPSPDVVVVCIPEAVMDELRPEGRDHAKVKVDGRDLHNQVKLLGMEHELQTQLIKPSSLDFSNKWEKASFAWNISMGLLYKTQEGHPWKTKDIDETTCFAGISFYRKKDKEGSVRASLAHVFTKHGHTILQSEPMKNLDEDDNQQPHLSWEGARQIANQILDFYTSHHRGATPKRLVLHKSSEFWRNERRGFLDPIDEEQTVCDFVAIQDQTDLRLFTEGTYPPLRGTLLSIPSDDTHYLSTVGYTPEIATYKDSGVPEPIKIKPDPIVCETPTRKLCREILYLTKLDWNTTDPSTKIPITIKAARKVGNVLKEPNIDPQDDKIKVQYYYYM